MNRTIQACPLPSLSLSVSPRSAPPLLINIQSSCSHAAAQPLSDELFANNGIGRSLLWLRRLLMYWRWSQHVCSAPVRSALADCCSLLLLIYTINPVIICHTISSICLRRLRLTDVLLTCWYVSLARVQKLTEPRIQNHIKMKGEVKEPKVEKWQLQCIATWGHPTQRHTSHSEL